MKQLFLKRDKNEIYGRTYNDLYIIYVFIFLYVQTPLDYQQNTQA